MTAYNQHTFTAVSVGPTGHQHERAADAEEGAPTAIDCAACEPFLAADGWVFDPSLVPLTDRQIAEQEKRDREGAAAVRQAAAALAEGLGAAAERRTRAEKKAAAKPEPKARTPRARTPRAAAKAQPQVATKVESKPVVVIESSSPDDD